MKRRANGHDTTGNRILQVRASNAAKKAQIKAKGPKPPTTDWHIPAELITLIKRMRFNPIRGLTPDLLSQHLDWWYIGFLRYSALDWEYMENRHPVIKADAPKRKKAVSRHGWEILTNPNADKEQAEAHKQALEYFYGHLQATHAVDQNELGGVSLLIRQMMDSVGKRFAVHEIVWRPSPEGITAQFRFVPLWFFENTTGQLRWLKDPFNPLVGQDLEPAEWMVTCGDGIMEACSILYMYGFILAFRDMIALSERFGMPIPLAKTDAPIGSEAWEAAKDAVGNLMNEFSAVVGMNTVIELLKAEVGAGQLPMPWIIERCDQYISALWRGADLATLSKGGHAGGGKQIGASVQKDEGGILEGDDAVVISETLNENIDRYVIEYTFGEGVEPLAYFKVRRPEQKDAKLDLEIDDWMVAHGLPLGVDATLERYGREKPDEADELIKPISATAVDPLEKKLQDDEAEANNELAQKLSENARIALAVAQAAALKPVSEKLRAILAIADDTEMVKELRHFQVDLPDYLRQINADPATATILANTISAALLNGLTKVTK